MIPRELGQTAAAEQISAAVAYVSDAESCVIDPYRRESCAHAALLFVCFGGLENISIGQMNGRRKTFRARAPLGLYGPDNLGRRIGLEVQAMLHDCFNSHRAGNFSVSFASHAVGKHKEVQRLNDLEAIFVVGTDPTYIGHAAACNSHTNSRCPLEITPLPIPIPGDSVPKLPEPQGPRKALNPTDYSLFRYTGIRG